MSIQSSRQQDYDFLIAGAGFSGAVIAERLASQLGLRCLVIDRRDHIAGNAYDAKDDAGVLLHQYGPHYFRTNSQRIVNYLSHFTEWHEVEYKILSWAEGQYWQFPINLNTFEQLVGHSSTEEEMKATLESWRVPIANPQNSEDVIVSQVGWKLYEMFFKNYTRKQWRRDPKELDASVCGRIPIRTNRDDRYLSDSFQALPKEGYTALISRILDHPLIDIQLGTDLNMVRDTISFRRLVYTGPIDEYFDYCHGPLPYRSLRFEPETLQQEFFQPVMQVNYPNDHAFTRIVEIKHATGQELPHTTIVREYPADYEPGGEAYYPIPAPDSAAIYSKYAAMAAAETHTHFIGRLAKYKYYNMDQVIGMALAEFEKIANRFTV